MLEKMPSPHHIGPEGQTPAEDQVTQDEPQPKHTTGAILTQQAIFDSELYWFGGLRNSDDIHASLGDPIPRVDP